MEKHLETSNTNINEDELEQKYLVYLEIFCLLYPYSYVKVFFFFNMHKVMLITTNAVRFIYEPHST